MDVPIQIGRRADCFHSINKTIPANGVSAWENPGVCLQRFLVADGNGEIHFTIRAASWIGQAGCKHCCGDLYYIVRDANAGWGIPGRVLRYRLWEGRFNVYCHEQANE